MMGFSGTWHAEQCRVLVLDRRILAGFAVALVTAFVIGRAILFGIYAAVIQHFPKIDMKSEVSWRCI